jgi:hypothetical protein
MNLIDAGRSRRGWSRIGNFFKCPQLFAYQSRLNIQLIPADALTRGSMGHVMQAHMHAKWGAEQGGVWVDETHHTDPDYFLTPEDAVIEYCDRHGGHEHLDRMMETFRNYCRQYPDPPGRVIAVEQPMTATLGYVDGSWGLHVERDGVTIEPTPLEMPGHPEHGKPIQMTRRIDMTVVDRMGRTFIWDHKNQAYVAPNKSIDAYAIDGGFAAFRIMGAQLYGRSFSGLMLNLIQTTAPWRVARPTVPPTPHRDRHFAKMVWRAEHDIARLDLEEPDFWEWPKAQHETTCFGRYGKCPATRACFFGKAGLAE